MTAATTTTTKTTTTTFAVLVLVLVQQFRFRTRNKKAVSRISGTIMAIYMKFLAKPRFFSLYCLVQPNP